MPQRLRYILTVLLVIMLGILSRQFAFIPLFVGDLLYAIMVYFVIRTLFLRVSLPVTAVMALLFCSAIELLQLWRAAWLIEIRNTFLGHYALGQGFRFSDLLAYAIGAALALLTDNMVVDAIRRT